MLFCESTLFPSESFAAQVHSCCSLQFSTSFWCQVSSDYRLDDLVKVFAVRRVCAGALPHDRCAYVLHWRPSEASILASIDQEES